MWGESIPLGEGRLLEARAPKVQHFTLAFRTATFPSSLNAAALNPLNPVA